MRKFMLFILSALLVFNSCDDGSGNEENPGTPGADTILTVSTSLYYDTGSFDSSAAEIVEYDSLNGKYLFTNGSEGSVNILSAGTGNLTLDSNVLFASGDANSVSVYNGVAAVAVAASVKTDAGTVSFVDCTDGSILGSVAVGALPDMVTFTPDGKYVLVANEGEPDEEYLNDPEGSVSLIEVDFDDPSNSSVRTITFSASDCEDDSDGVPVRTHDYLDNYLAGHTVAKDIEPEYIAVDADSKYAYVVCQENNAIAKIDIAGGTVETLKSLGYKDFSSCGIDIYEDGAVDVKSQPVYGLYMPDAITVFEIDGKTYIATANEGDDRGDWEDGTAFEDNDCIKVKKIDDLGFSLDEQFLDDAGDVLAEFENLKVSPHDCIDSDGDGDIDILVSFGARSFSIWDEDLDLVYDSGSLFEDYTGSLEPSFFNCSNDNLVIDDRSPKKGPEPEAIAYGEVDGKDLLFVGLERFGGFFVFDVSDPDSPEMELYHTDRNFDAQVNGDSEYDDDSLSNTGDLAPEGFCFISSGESSDGKPKLIVGSEVSGTVRIYDISYQ